MVIDKSPNIFQNGIQNMTEPKTVPEGEQQKPPAEYENQMDQETEK